MLVLTYVVCVTLPMDTGLTRLLITASYAQPQLPIVLPVLLMVCAEHVIQEVDTGLIQPTVSATFVQPQYPIALLVLPMPFVVHAIQEVDTG